MKQSEHIQRIAHSAYNLYGLTDQGRNWFNYELIVSQATEDNEDKKKEEPN